MAGSTVVQLGDSVVVDSMDAAVAAPSSVIGEVVSEGESLPVTS